MRILTLAKVKDNYFRDRILTECERKINEDNVIPSKAEYKLLYTACTYTYINTLPTYTNISRVCGGTFIHISFIHYHILHNTHTPVC